MGGIALVGAGFGPIETNWGKVGLGVIFTISGWALVYLGLLATGIKTIIDAVADHAQIRLDPTANDNSTLTAREPRRRTTGGTHSSSRRSPTSSGQAVPGTRLSTSAPPIDEITVRSTGEPIGLSVRMPGPWSLSRYGGGSPFDGSVVVDLNIGSDDQIVYFSWNVGHELFAPDSFEFVVIGQSARIQKITVHAIE